MTKHGFLSALALIGTMGIASTTGATPATHPLSRNADGRLHALYTVPHELDSLIKHGHIQGATCSDEALYLSHAGGIFKIDWHTGHVLAACSAESHLGDIAFDRGRIYGVYGLWNPPAGKSRCKISAWDKDLNPIPGTDLYYDPPRSAKGLDGAVVLGDTLYVGVDYSGYKTHRDCSVMRFSVPDLKPLEPQDILFDYSIFYGVQTLATDGKDLLFGNYGGESDDVNPKRYNFTRVTADLTFIDSGRFHASEGFGLVPPALTGRATPVFFNVNALGGNMQGWRKDPTNNPPRIRIDFYAYDRATGTMTDITDRAPRTPAPPRTAAPVLGYHLDISNAKVPRLEMMFHIVDILAKLGYNHLQMNTEHTFAYTQHKAVWHAASPMTPDDVRKLDDYCATHGIELVPNQNSFGHLHKWLRLPEYNHLAESPMGGCHSAYRAKPMKAPMSLCPTDPRAIEFLAGLYDELLPCFRSKQFNVGLDETYELDDITGCGRSAAAIKQKGAERIYLEHFKKVYALAKARGHTIMFWGDIILHKPELIPEIPEDVTCLNWGYGQNHPFDKEAAQFAAAHRRFIICPGTWAWGTISGMVPYMCKNVDRAVAAGKKHGAAGYLMADWDDGGALSPWIVSLPPIVYLSLRVRGIQPTREQFAAEIDRVAGCTCGEALLAYGEIYLKSKGRLDGIATEMCAALRLGTHYTRAKGVTDETLAAAKAQHEKAAAHFDASTAPQWIKDDFAMLDLVCRASEVRTAKPDTANFRAMFEPTYRRLWLTNNRPGGLEDSLNINFGL